MSNFKKVQPGLIGGQTISDTSTTAKHPLGTIVQAKDLASTDYGVGEFIYLGRCLHSGRFRGHV
jgi:hypothetical protein